MSLTDYMGDAPGFMSYQRQRRTDGIKVPERAKPAREAAPLREFDLKFEGNPGDKQELYDRNKAFNSTMLGLYNEYGGEMDWVRTDDRYKQAVNNNAMFVRDQQAAKQNKVNTDNRLNKLNDMNSGQANSDYELSYEDGMFVAKKFGNKNNIETKGDYVQDVIWNPQLIKNEDGTTSIHHTQFDYGSGTENDMIDLLSKVFSGLGANEWGNDTTKSTDMSQKGLDGIEYKVKGLTQRGVDHKDNYNQVNDSVNFLINYGFDETHRYFLSQKMMHDYESKKSFRSPKFNEDGTVELDKNGNPILEQRYLTKEDVSDPNKMRLLFSYYAQDYITEFSKKYYDKKHKTSSNDDDVYKNMMPDEYGGVGMIEPERNLERWEARMMNLGPKDPEYQKNNTVWVSDGKGGFKAKTLPNEYYDDGNDPQGMEQVRAAIKNKTIGSVSNGEIMVGGLWQKVDAEDFKGLSIGDVKSVKKVLSKDGKSFEYVADVDIAIHEDENDFDDLKVWDPYQRKKVPIVNSTFGIDYLEGMASEGYGVVKWQSKTDLKDKGINVNDNYDHYGYDSEMAKVVRVSVPIKSLIDNLDQYKVGQSQENKNRINIEVAGSSNATKADIANQKMRDAQFLKDGKITK